MNLYKEEMMTDKSKKFEIDLEKERAQVIYTTDKGRVKVSFEQIKLSDSDPEVSQDSINLVAKVESKSKFKFFYNEIASASEEVYFSWFDGRNNGYGSRGNKNFEYNMENVLIKHDNPEIEKIIQQAQKDIVEYIPEEKQRLQRLEEQKKQEESQMSAQEALKRREKEKMFTKRFFDSLSRRE